MKNFVIIDFDTLNFLRALQLLMNLTGWNMKVFDLSLLKYALQVTAMWLLKWTIY